MEEVGPEAVCAAPGLAGVAELVVAARFCGSRIASLASLELAR
jgi:hypothetical protein